MACMTSPQSPPPSPREKSPIGRSLGKPEQGWPRWVVWASLGLLLALLVLPGFENLTSLPYDLSHAKD